MEHRWGRRIEIRIPVRLATETGEPMLGQMTSASISGAFVETPRPMRVWTQVEVEVIDRYHSAIRAPERVVAHVTRQSSRGAGIEWCDVAPSSVRALIEAMNSASRATGHDNAR